MSLHLLVDSDERHHGKALSDPLPTLASGVSMVGSILEGGTTRPSTPSPSHPNPPPSPSNLSPHSSPSSPPSPSPSPSPSPPSPHTSTPPPSTPGPSTPPPPPHTSPSTPSPSTRSPTPRLFSPGFSRIVLSQATSHPFTPSTQPSSIPLLSTPPPSTSPFSALPLSTPSTSPLPTPSSTPPPSPAPAQSTASPSSTGGSSSPSSNSPIPPSSGTGGSSSDAGVPSSPSFTTPTALPSSLSTQNGLSLEIPRSTVTGGSISTADSISSSISLASTSLSSTPSPHITIGRTDSGPLSDTITTQSAVIFSGSHFLINPSSTNVPSGAASNSVTSASALADPHVQLSSGQIVAIVIVLLLLFITLPIIVFFLRRRSKIFRADRRTRWWFATSQLYGDGATEHLIPPGTARSSFVTTVDHSDPTRSPPTYVIPAFPAAMAETGRDNASRPVLGIKRSSNTNLEENRHSTRSPGSDQSKYSEPSPPSYVIPPPPPAMVETERDNALRPVLDIRQSSNNNLEENWHSIGSDHSKYLIVQHRNSSTTVLQAATSMSVRPFSPSESFAFPKPPEPVATGSGSGSVVGSSSRRTSSGTSVTLSTPLPPPGLSSTPSFVPLVGPNTTKSPSPTTNPSTDPATTTTDNALHSDNPVDSEVVNRPFEPTLPDELGVKLNERVRVLHRFDDGWGLIEKVKGDARGEERGVIPMDCLEKAGGALETSRRRSSYEGPYAF